MKEEVKFDNFTLNFTSGELTDNSDENIEVVRLSPKSTQLLQLLINKFPEIVGKEEIKSTLWHDVEIDFDNSLHFCIRQIRIALKDNASNPTYIKTVPKRGYKWLVKVKPSKQKNIPRVLALFTAIIIAASLGHYYFNSKQQQMSAVIENQAKTGLIIMPLQPSDSLNSFYGNMMAYNLLEMFGGKNKYDVIGPTTTINVKGEQVYNFLESSGADYVINGKFSGTESESQVLIEIIRNSDKAHIWVKAYDATSSVEHITQEIHDGFAEQIDEPTSRPDTN